MIPPLSDLKPQSFDTNCTIHNMTFNWENECPGCIEDDLTQEANKFEAMLDWAELKASNLTYRIHRTPHLLIAFRFNRSNSAKQNRASCKNRPTNKRTQ